MSRLWRVVCGKESSAADLELARRDAQNLFGSSGGGATAMFADDNLIAVAGAGGGLYPEAFISQSDNNSDSSGGQIYNETFKYTTKQPFWSAGNGASFGPMVILLNSKCLNFLFSRNSQTTFHQLVPTVLKWPAILQ